jgi:putative alpha-1,2-mannosidase
LFFVAHFSQPIAAEQIQDSTKAALSFDLTDGKSLLLKVAISSVSVDNACQNLEVKLSDWDFEQTKKTAEAIWEAKLSKVRVESGTKAERINFYTALYHAFIVPNLYMDVNGEFNGRKGKTYTADGDNYTVFSFGTPTVPLIRFIPFYSQNVTKILFALFCACTIMAGFYLCGNWLVTRLSA